jgi:hypothetical protein
VVKALDQFGRLSSVKAVDRVCTTIRIGPAANQTFCSVAGFDFTHARYSSPYLAFASRDLIRPAGNRVQRFQPLTPVEMRLYLQYARPRVKPTCYRMDSSDKFIRDRNGQLETYACTSFTDYASEAAGDPTGNRRLPLITVGGYLQSESQLAIAGDLSETLPLTPQPGAISAGYQTGYSFNDLQQALITSKDLRPPPNHLVEDVNAEANIMTALICHADGKKPASVCGRPAIREILRSVK